MNKLIAVLFSFFLFTNAYAAEQKVPDEFSINEHWVSWTTSFDIETPTHKLGTLYRKFFSLLLTYEFFDPFDNKMATARSKFFSFTAHFDIYDRDERLIGSAEERMFTFFPTFDIFASDNSTKLAQASMNFWGTTFTIYDPVTGQEMAIMYRPFFRLKNDWNIKITNRPLFEQKYIDFRVLMTVLAFQGDRETWAAQNSARGIAKNGQGNPEVSAKQLTTLKSKVGAMSTEAGLSQVQKPDPETLEQIATELETNYNATLETSAEQLSSLERLNSFITYSLNLIKTEPMADSKKKAIIYLLQMRLDSNV